MKASNDIYISMFVLSKPILLQALIKAQLSKNNTLNIMTDATMKVYYYMHYFKCKTLLILNILSHTHQKVIIFNNYLIIHDILTFSKINLRHNKRYEDMQISYDHKKANGYNCNKQTKQKIIEKHFQKKGQIAWLNSYQESICIKQEKLVPNPSYKKNVNIK